MRRVALCGLILAASFAGCVEPASPDSGLRLSATGIELLPVPDTAAFAGTVAVSWRVHNPLGAPVAATELRFGPGSSGDARNLSEASYPFSLDPGNPAADGTYSAILRTNTSSVFLRAWVRLGGEEWWSREARILVAGAPFGDPEVRLSAPRNASAGEPVAVTWSVANATGGVAELNALPGAAAAKTRPAGAVRLSIPLNRSAATFHANVTIPYPGAWTLVASLNLSGSVVAANATSLRVREPATPNIAFVAPPADAAPGERVALRFRVNGPGTLGFARLVANGEDRDATYAGARNFTATAFAPPSGSLTVRARVLVDDVPLESAPLSLRVVSREPWSVTLVNYANSTLPAGVVPIRFRVSGPASEAGFAGIHSGNRSVLRPSDQLSPGNYTGATVVADGGDAGLWQVPGLFYANLSAPAQPGVTYFRARVSIGGVSYWSQEGSVLVRS